VLAQSSAYCHIMVKSRIKPRGTFPLMILLLLLLSGTVFAEFNPLLSKIHATPPCPEVLAAARANEIPVDQIDSLAETKKLHPGDSITALITLNEKGKRCTQWLLYLKVSTNDKPASSNADAAARTSTRTVYASTGGKLEFRSQPVPVTLRTLGPFDASPRKRSIKPHDKTAHFALDEGFLALGLDNAAVAVSRLKQTKVKGSFSFSDHPFSEADIARNREATRAVQLTSDEQRALAGAGPALNSYLHIVQRTEGLSDILIELIDLPSMWSLVRKGVNVQFRFLNEHLGPVDDSAWNLTLPIYSVPTALEINKHRALNITFVATAARPPLLPCAGVVALLAEKPRDKDTYLTLRILSARRAAVPNTSLERPLAR
jgi:hypothetical protein